MPAPDGLRPRLPGRIARVAVAMGVAFAATSIWLPYHREQEVIAEIKGWGGFAAVSNGGPAWLRRLVGDEPMRFFDRVSAVYLKGSAFGDADLSHLEWFAHLEHLHAPSTH